MKIEVGTSTDAGPRKGENQDSLLVAASEVTPGVSLLVVADGMGGARAGDLASQMAVRLISEGIFNQPDLSEENAAEYLTDAIENANLAIYRKSQSAPKFHGMGCTVVAVLIIEDVYWVASVGDSRVYLVRDGGGYQLTDDHTWVGARVREGVLTPDQAANHALRHVLERALGVQPTVETDLRPDEIFEDGDSLVLCSDGLYGVIDDETIASEVSQLPPQKAADTLLQLAIDAPTHDNTTIIVMRFSL